jgi:NADPH:quinone reductase-like Zn-dependent oxidoreductase
VAEAIDADPATIDREARFADIGVDSLASGDVARLLSIALGRPVAAHVIDDHATPIRLARYLGSQGAAPPAAVRSPVAAAGPAPTGALEAMVVEIIATVTGTDAAAVDSRLRFVELGVESILAGDAAQLLSRRLGRTVSPAVFNEHPTVAALARYLGDASRAASGPGPVSKTQIWDLAERGDLSSLSPRDSVRQAPGAGEVEVEVIAAGLNFRDVMEALGRIGDEARPLGLEFAGRVTAVGQGVAGLSPGDEVVGLRIGCLARHVVTRATLVAPKPAHLSFAEAAGLPIVFLTAAATLERIARLRPGRTVLVHAASGGVGLAALQIARAAGATVLATAGSPEKRAHLQALGVECVADSRSVSFADAVRRATGGAGVDVVLNCLAGAMTDAGLALVRPGGTFIEIGKTDIRPADEIARRHPGIGYAVYDLLGEIDRQPDRVGVELATLMKRFVPGGLTALPVRCFRFEEAATALRFLARARHIGKVAVGLEAVEPVVSLPSSRPRSEETLSQPATAYRREKVSPRGPSGPGRDDGEAIWLQS